MTTATRMDPNPTAETPKTTQSGALSFGSVLAGASTAHAAPAAAAHSAHQAEASAPVQSAEPEPQPVAKAAKSPLHSAAQPESSKQQANSTAPGNSGPQSSAKVAVHASGHDQKPDAPATAATVVVPTTPAVPQPVSVPVFAEQLLPAGAEKTDNSSSGSEARPVGASAADSSSDAKVQGVRSKSQERAFSGLTVEALPLMSDLEAGTSSDAAVDTAPSAVPSSNGVAADSAAKPVANLSSTNAPAVAPITPASSPAASAQTAPKATQAVQSANPAPSKIPDTVTATPAAAKNNGAGGSTAAAHSTAASASAGVSADPTQAGAAPAVQGKPADVPSSPVPAAVAHITPSETTGASRSSGHADLPRTADAGLPLENSGAASGINTSRLIQTLGETEMRVGLRSSDFGEISIRTSVSQQQMLTQISVDHSELGRAIAAHLPLVQAKLVADYGLHAAIEVSQTGMSFSGESGSSSQRGQRSFTAPAKGEGAASVTDADPVVVRSLSAVADGSRLSIRA